MKERHTGTWLTFFAVTFNPMGVESGEAEACVSNGETVRQSPRAAFSVNNTSKHPLFQFIPCTLSSPPNVNQTLSPSVLTHTLPTTTSLFFPAFSLPLFVCHSAAAMIRTATANQTASELPRYLFFFTNKILLWLSTDLVTSSSSSPVAFVVFLPYPLSCLIRRDEKEWSRGGDHGRSVQSKPN